MEERTFDCHFCRTTTIDESKWSRSIPFQVGDDKGRRICNGCVKRICATPGCHRAESIEDLRYVDCPACDGMGEILAPYATNYGETCESCGGWRKVFRCPTPLELLAEQAE